MEKNDLGRLPATAAPYKRTPLFSHASVPAGLTKDHSTKEGIWGVLTVEKGSLDYFVPSASVKLQLSAGDKALIEPTVLHRVALAPEAEFFVEFWR